MSEVVPGEMIGGLFCSLPTWILNRVKNSSPLQMLVIFFLFQSCKKFMLLLNILLDDKEVSFVENKW